MASKVNNVNPCDTVYHASPALFRVPIISYKANLSSIGLQCAVYRGDVMQYIQGKQLGYLYEYYFNYDTKFLEWSINMETAKEIFKKVGVVCKRYNPAWYKHWTAKFIDNNLETIYGSAKELSTIDVLSEIATLAHNFDVVPMALNELGYTYIRKGCFAYDSLLDGRRGIHYDIIVLQPQNLKIKKVLQITDNTVNGVVDITPIMATLSV